ncbi:MAG TPA: helix-turn-helix domain-containing protein, partial [Labilithrix sp.]|nr:helix-turn-helix domain-containing protein [Labilithrix sp.]
DLYFRLNGVTLKIPPLRERVAEIGPLALRFANEARRAAGRGPLHIAPETVVALTGYGWPGNIRELRNVIERALLFCEGDTLRPEHLSLPRPMAMTLPDVDAMVADESSDDERQRVLAALEACAGNQTHAARMLGISRGTLITRLAKYNVPRPRKR